MIVRNYKPSDESIDFTFLGTQTQINGIEYVHGIGVKQFSRGHNFLKALTETIKTFGIGIFTSEKIQRHYKKAFFGEARICRLIEKKTLETKGWVTAFNSSREDLKANIQSSLSLVMPLYFDAYQKLQELKPFISYDRELALEGLEKFRAHTYLPFIDEKLIVNDCEIALKVLSIQSESTLKEFFSKLDPSLKSNPNFIIGALNTEFRKFFGVRIANFLDLSSFKDSKEFFLDLIKETKNFTFLDYASDNLLSNPSFFNSLSEIIKSFNEQNIKKDAIIFPPWVSEIVQEKIIDDLYDIDPNFLASMNKKFLADPDKVRNIISRNPLGYIYLDKKLKMDVEFNKSLLEKNPLVFPHVSRELPCYEEMALESILKAPALLAELKCDLSIKFFEKLCERLASELSTNLDNRFYVFAKQFFSPSHYFDLEKRNIFEHHFRPFVTDENGKIDEKKISDLKESIRWVGFKLHVDDLFKKEEA